MRRASDTTLVSRRRQISRDVKSLPCIHSLPMLHDQLETSGIWEGPEEMIRGRMIADSEGFEPTEEKVRVSIRQSNKKVFWQKDKQLDVIDTRNGELFGGSARVKMNSRGFDLKGKSNKVVVRCIDVKSVDATSVTDFSPSSHQIDIVICSTKSLSCHDVPDKSIGNFYRWFKVSVDRLTNDLSLELWSGSQYYPLWYADKIAEGNEIDIKSVADDAIVGKLCGEDVVESLAGVDPAIMICIGVAMKRLRTMYACDDLS